MELPGRGAVFVRHQVAPLGAPTVLLLHGIGVTADANWFPAYPSLVGRYGVVAVDHRGHGRSSRQRGRLTLADLADDAAAALAALELRSAVVVGYSMGGPVAQLLWHRHRELTSGLVLCATAHRFRGFEPMRDVLPSLVQRVRAAGVPVERRGRLDAGLARWVASELARTDQRSAIRLGLSMAGFDSSAWIGQVDVPHAVVVSTRDAAVVPPRQRRMAAALPDATVVEAAIDHTGCVTRPAVFVPALLEALEAVTPSPAPWAEGRSETASPPG